MTTELMLGYGSVVVLVLLLASGMPVALSMGLTGFFGLLYFFPVKLAGLIIATEVYVHFASYHMLVIPLFVWMGMLADVEGIGKGLIDLASAWFSKIRGGLAMATMAACAMFGAICGSPVATAASVGTVAIPEMKKREYDIDFAAATAASGGILGMLIPPSIGAIVYSILTDGEASITTMFVAGIPCGLLLLLFFCVQIAIQVKASPRLAPPGYSVSWREKFSAFAKRGVGETAVVFIVVIGGLTVGLFTPTEGAAIGCAALVIVGLIRRQLTWGGFMNSVGRSMRTGVMVILMISMAMVYGRFIAMTRMPYAIADWMIGLGVGPTAIVFLTLFITWIGGMFLDAAALQVLLVPIFLPLIKRSGIGLVWWYVARTVGGGIAQITPPVCLSIYVTAALAKRDIMAVVAKVWPFIIAQVLCGTVFLFWPQVSLFLPEILGMRLG